MNYSDDDQKCSKPKSLLEAWRERRSRSVPGAQRRSILIDWLKRKANLPSWSGQNSTTAPFPPDEQTPGVPDTGSSADRKDGCGRPQPRVHRDAPTGGPFRPA